MNWASSTMNRPAMATRLNARATAEVTGFRCVMTTMPEATTRSARTKKAISSSGASVPHHAVGDEDRREGEVRERQREQTLPAQIHQLVVAEARDRPAHPRVEELEERHLEDEGEDLRAPQQPAR